MDLRRSVSARNHRLIESCVLRIEKSHVTVRGIWDVGIQIALYFLSSFFGNNTQFPVYTKT
jgi:hypothetical protein